MKWKQFPKCNDNTEYGKNKKDELMKICHLFRLLQKQRIGEQFNSLLHSRISW